MKMTLRWFGDQDTVRLQDIAQIPIVQGIVGTLEGMTVEQVWTYEQFMTLRQQVEAYGLTLDVIESIPVAEAIKQGKPERDRFIDIYCESICHMGQAGIRVLCYNFMPVLDWMRTDMTMQLSDGAMVTGYQHQDMLKFDISQGLAERVAWARGFSGDELQAALDEYREIDEDVLFENLVYFLQRVIPVAEEANVFLAIHPDDPPWSILGLPRIVRDSDSIQRILDAVDSPHHGLTFCTGSLGTSLENDLPEMLRQFAERIHFVHLRNVCVPEAKTFYEVAHSDPSGSVDMAAMMTALIEINYTGPLRPDHGRLIWGESARTGYGLYDRAMAAMYLHGLWEGQGYARKISK